MPFAFDTALAPAARGSRSVALACLLAAVSPASTHASPEATASLAGLVETLRAMPRLDRAGVERIVGRALTPRDGNPYFALWEASDVTLGSLRVATVDFREPKPGSGATAGPILVLKIGRGCPTRREVEDRFRPLTLTGVPRGHSLDEETSLSRAEPLGRLSFGFTERHPDCLASVALSVPKPPE